MFCAMAAAAIRIDAGMPGARSRRQFTSALTATRLARFEQRRCLFTGRRNRIGMTAETKARAACLIGWPAAHSRSPLIHHYWLRTLGIEGGYNIEAVPPEGFAEFVLHLSTARLCRRQRHHSAQGARAGAVQAGRPRPRGRRGQYAVVRGRRAALDQHRHRRFYQQSRRLRAGMGRRRRCAGARRRRVVARGGVRADRARHQARASGKPDHRTGPRACRSIRRQGSSRFHGRRSAICCRAPDCW